MELTPLNFPVKLQKWNEGNSWGKFLGFKIALLLVVARNHHKLSILVTIFSVIGGLKPHKTYSFFKKKIIMNFHVLINNYVNKKSKDFFYSFSISLKPNTSKFTIFLIYFHLFIFLFSIFIYSIFFFYQHTIRKKAKQIKNK